MKVRGLIYPVVGCVVLLGAWEVAGRSGILGKTFPPSAKYCVSTEKVRNGNC